jgi:hypothetical protein
MKVGANGGFMAGRATSTVLALVIFVFASGAIASIARAHPPRPAPAANDPASSDPPNARPSDTAAETGSGPLPNTFFAITTGALKSGSSWPVPVPFGTSGKATSGSYWFNLQPSKGSYNWAPLDNIVNSARSAGVNNIMYCFFETPQWASSNPTQRCAATLRWHVLGCAAPPTNIQDWDNFVAAVATRYKGKIQYYEPWNEPDVKSEFSGSVPEMVTLAQHAYRIIKSIDPSAIVLTPSVSWAGVLSSDPHGDPRFSWLAAYLAAGGGKYADGVTFHGKALDSSVSVAAEHHIACPGNAIAQCGDAPLIHQIQYARALMAKYGLAGKPLINTEGGYSISLASHDVADAPADQQAAYVSRFFIVQASENLSMAVWFSWMQNMTRFNFTGFGTKPAEAQNNQAYRQTYQWLVGSTLKGPCSENSESIWTCRLTLASGHAGLIVWSDSATSYKAAPSYTSYQDLAGAQHPIHGTVPIGILPILIE